MTTVQFELIQDGDEQSITVYIPRLDFVRSVRSDQGPFKAIKRLAFEYDSIQDGVPEDAEGRSCPGRELTDEENQRLIDLFEVEKAIQRRFVRLGERFAARNGIIYKDGDPLDANDPWAKQVLAFVEQDVEDWKPLVAFQDKLDSNPNAHSRDQFYDFLTKYPITITEDGDVVLYKGLNRRGEQTGYYYNENTNPTSDDEVRYPYQSCSAGPDTIVDDEVQPNGRIKQGPGAVVEHPRSKVHFDPSRACSNGLHCGTYSYASGFGSVVVRVLVNPRDVVNVPTHDHKVRVCRYHVLDVAEHDYSSEALLVHDTSTISGTVTADIDPSEAPYVPSAATYDVDEGETVPEMISDLTDGYSASDAQADQDAYETTLDPAPNPHDLRDDEPDDIEEERCCDCEELDDDCVCEAEDYDFCDDCERLTCECLSDAGQIEEDMMTSLSTPMPERQDYREMFPTEPTKAPRKRYPAPAKWAAIQTERKTRKKGIAKLAEREGWVLDGDDPSERKSWVIPPRS